MSIDLFLQNLANFVARKAGESSAGIKAVSRWVALANALLDILRLNQILSGLGAFWLFKSKKNLQDFGKGSSFFAWPRILSKDDLAGKFP